MLLGNFRSHHQSEKSARPQEGSQTRESVERHMLKQQPPPLAFEQTPRTPSRDSFFQLTGHTECFKVGPRPGTILKKATGNEQDCLLELRRDPHLAPFVPRVYGTCEQGGQTYLELQDLLIGFKNASVMDVKMGFRTYCEEELYRASHEAQMRHDMFDKMIQVDENEPTEEERRLRAVTKPRYMIWRESVSSTASLGFRIEGMRLRDGTIDKDFKTIKDEEQVARAFIRYTKSFSTRLKYLQRLYDLKQALTHSMFFLTHEMIGSSLLFIHDDDDANIWLIDFAKTHTLPENIRVNHVNKWELGNHEDGYLAGIENLIRLFEMITVPATTKTNNSQ